MDGDDWKIILTLMFASALAGGAVTMAVVSANKESGEEEAALNPDEAYAHDYAHAVRMAQEHPRELGPAVYSALKDGLLTSQESDKLREEEDAFLLKLERDGAKESVERALFTHFGEGRQE
jgi:hypothetical protein